MSFCIKKIGHKIQCMLLDLLAKSTGGMKLTQRRKLAELLTWLAFDILQLRRKYVVSAISLHLELSPDEATKMARRVYFNFLLNAFEMAGLKFMSAEDLKSRLVCTDLAILEQALSRKKGAIIISGHFGLWELVPPWLSLSGFPVTVVVRRQNNPEVDRWMEEMRQKHGARTTDSGFGIREILKSLRKGHILALMVDQDNGKQGVFVPFFKTWASAPTGPAAISIKTGAPIV
ncbi:MAG: lysophospholipid acyltransferase family protein, partial [Candidatus Rifleibacteriota bacterium]